MRRESLVVALALLVAAAAAAGVYSEFGRAASGNSTTAGNTSTHVVSTPTGCTTEFPAGLALRGQGNETRLFALLPGSTGLICVTYNVDSGEISGTAITLNFSSSIDLVQATYGPSPNGEGDVYSYAYQAAPGIKETADPADLSFTRGTGNSTVTVAYRITASQNSSGFYSLAFTGCSPLIPLAVTNDWTGVEAADFSGFFVSAACVYQPPLTSVLVTGLAAVNSTLLSG